MTAAQQAAQRLIDRLTASGQEAGIQVAAYLHGEPVVSACAGMADAEAGRAVEEHTLFNSWSTGKGSTSTLVHALAEDGLIGYDVPVAHYWPEFGAHGKHAITVAHVLTHSAGVPQAPTGASLADLADWNRMSSRIADLSPLWQPGTATGYHAVTFGYILGEVVRRVTGRPISAALRERVTQPLGITDELFYGVPHPELDRVARLQDGNWPTILAARPDDSLFFTAAPHAIQAGAELGNQASYLTTDVPCAGTMSARALARMYAALIGHVDGIRLVSPERTAQIATVRTTEIDRVLGAPIPKGLGYFMGLPEMGQRPTAFGCKGSGGSIAFADPESSFSFAMTHSTLTGPPADVAERIADTVRYALGLRP
jgi:CubicO group peptidase (beta-lactamase class C family)